MSLTSFGGHKENLKNHCRFKTWMGIVGQLLIKSVIRGFLQSPLCCSLGSNVCKYGGHSVTIEACISEEAVWYGGLEAKRNWLRYVCFFCGWSVYQDITDIVHLSNSIQLLEWPYINISHFPWMAHSNNAVRHLRINWYRLTFMSMQHMISYNMLKPKWNGITFRVEDFPTPTLIICVNIYVIKCSMIILSSNTLRPRQNGRHFADDTFIHIFINENVWIFVPKGLVNNIPALVQIMAWRRPGDKSLSEPMMVNILTYICVTRPQWVKADVRDTIVVIKQFAYSRPLSTCPIYDALGNWLQICIFNACFLCIPQFLSVGYVFILLTA